MTIRTTLTDATRKARMGTSRATIRSVSDDHLMQQVNHADVHHSETPTDFERWQMVGMTSVPIDQQEEEGQQQQKSAPQSDVSEDGDWNHNQPKGPAAEAIMMYIGGSRSHPVAIVDDRRVRPYGMSPGEGANYAPDGSEQMVLFKATGTYITSLDGPSVADKKTNQTRFVSLRHVNKKMQTHKIEKQQSSGGQSGGGASAQQTAANGGASGGQQQGKYKHEGDSVNTEVRCSKDKISFFAGDTEVGYYEASSQTWYFKGKIAQMEFDKHYTTVTDRLEVIGTGDAQIKLGLDQKDEEGLPKVTTVGGPAKKVYGKV
jgi:phage gp45-like